MKKLKINRMEQVQGGSPDFWACYASWMQWHTDVGSMSSAAGMVRYYGLGCDSGWGNPNIP